MTSVGPTAAAAPVALVTGGSRGIGLAIASRLFTNGFSVAVNGVRPPAEVSGLAEAFGQPAADVEADTDQTSWSGKASGNGGEGATVGPRDGGPRKWIYCQGDIGRAADRAAIVERVRERFGRLNVLVNNAGVAPQQRLDPLEASEESFERVLRINLQGPYFLTQAVARWMVEQKRADPGFGGAIVNIGSISATVVSPNRGEYCISKAGLAMHSRIWAVRMAEFDVPVFEVRPGVIRTDMTAGVVERYDRLIADGLTVQRRWGTPDDVARAVVALARGDFPYSTGDVIMVDGGLTLQRL
jgi:3-oxoacyl-[acyl-carrier protein] reductase